MVIIIIMYLFIIKNSESIEEIIFKFKKILLCCYIDYWFYWMCLNFWLRVINFIILVYWIFYIVYNFNILVS